MTYVRTSIEPMLIKIIFLLGDKEVLTYILLLIEL